MTFKNFTRVEGLAVLMGEFESIQSKTNQARTLTERAKKVYLAEQAYQDACEDYRDLFSDMLKKILGSKSEAETSKVRLAYSIKLHKMVDVLRTTSMATGRVGEVMIESPAAASRASVESKVLDTQKIAEMARQVTETFMGVSVKPVVLETIDIKA